MKLTFLLKIKDCQEDFGLGPGILVKQEVNFEGVSLKDTANVMFIKALMEAEDKFIHDHIEVEIEEWKDV